MKYLVTGIVLATLVAASGFIFVYSGWYYVGADVSHGAVIDWFLHTTMERSVAARAEEVGPAPDLDNPDLIKLGAKHYRNNCVECHLGPGVGSTEIRAGLNPQPPKLANVAADLNDKWLFWVIKHGIRMTAMPAWGKTHTDHEIWAIVAFVKHLPRMTPEQFHALAGGGTGEHSGEHDHPHDEN